MARSRRVRVDKRERPRSAERKPEPAPREVAPAECSCPRLDADDWHDVESDWSDVQFARTAIPAVLGVPVGFNRVRARLEERARAMGASVPEDAMLLLGPGRVRRQVLLEVEGVEAGAKGLYEPGGVAFSRLVPAPWGEMRRRLTETVEKARERYGRAPDRTWIWYLTCNECSGERDFETLFVAHYAAPAARRPDAGSV